MPTHQKYVEDFDATVKLLREARKEFDRIADDTLTPETVRAEADAEALGITEKLALLATEKAAYLARHNSGMTAPSDTAVARSFSIAADLSKVIAAANRLPTILTSLTKLLDGLVALGKPAAVAAVAPAATAAKGTAPPAAFAAKVAGAKGPVTDIANGIQTPDSKTGFEVMESKLDSEQVSATPKTKKVSPSKKAGVNAGGKSNAPVENK